MSATTALAIVMLIWSLIGTAAAWIMGRRGHDWLTWWVLGTVLGPLVVPLALVTLVESPRTGTARPRATAGQVPESPDRHAQWPPRPPTAGSALAACWIETIGTQGWLPSL
jgi:membrane-associated phospholipid phosphatase